MQLRYTLSLDQLDIEWSDQPYTVIFVGDVEFMRATHKKKNIHHNKTTEKMLTIIIINCATQRHNSNRYVCIIILRRHSRVNRMIASASASTEYKNNICMIITNGRWPSATRQRNIYRIMLYQWYLIRFFFWNHNDHYECLPWAHLHRHLTKTERMRWKEIWYEKKREGQKEQNSVEWLIQHEYRM